MRNPTLIGAGAAGGAGGVSRAYPTYSLQGLGVDVVEGGTVSFAVLLTGADTAGGSVDWAVTRGTPADFGGSLPHGTATFPPGPTSVTVSVPTTGNALVDGTRTFTVSLSNPASGGVLGSPSTLAGTVTDDDAATGPWALYPSWGAVATAVVESGAPGTTGFTQTAQGVTLHEEAAGTTGALLEMWWKKLFQAAHDFTFTTEYTRSAMPGTSRTFALFWDVVGDGTASFPASMPDWTSLVFAQISHATGTYLIVDGGSQAQLFGFDKAAAVQIGASFTLTLTQGVVYVVKIQRAGTTVTLTVTDKAAGTVTGTTSWTDPKVKRGTADGYLGLRTKGILATIENNTLSDDGSVVVPVGWGTAPRSSRIASWETAKLSTETATLTEGADETVGVRLTAGVKDANDAHDGQRAIAQVSLQQVTPPGTLKLDYKPLSTWTAEGPLTTSGVFTIVALHALNSGGGDLSTLGTLSAGEWTANYTPVDNYYSHGGVSPAVAIGGRLSIDTHAYGAGTPSGSNKIRWRFVLADGTVLTAIGGVQTFDFRTPGGWSTVALLVDPANNKIVVTVTFSDGTAAAETMTDTRFGTLFTGVARNVVLGVYNGRDAQFRNVSWTPGSVVVVGPGTKAPFYVPNLAGKTAFPIANNTDLTTWLGKPAATYATQYGLVALGVNLPARTVTTAATKTNPCYIIAERNNAADHEDFTRRASVTDLVLGAAAKFVWYDGFVHQGSGSTDGAKVVGTDNFFTRGWVRCNQNSSGISTYDPSLRTRVGCMLFDSDSRSGNYGDIFQQFSSNRATNPDSWDCYANAHVSTVPDIGTAAKGMCLYAMPGIDSGNPDLTPPTGLNISQPHSFWRGCLVRNTSKFGVYAKHIPNFVECDGAFQDPSGTLQNHSHVFAFRGGSSVGGRMLYLRSACHTFSPGAVSSSNQAIALQSWYHEAGWCEAVGGVINVYAFCPQHDAQGNVIYNSQPGDGNKPLQQARYADIHHCKGQLCLGATRLDSQFGPETKLQNVVVSAHEGTIFDDSGKTVTFNGTTGAITSTHTWIETTGVNACKIFATDPKGRPARPASLVIPRNQVGPGCPNTTPWDGVGQWPKIEDYGSSPYV